jgi:hypothetical protein
MFHAIEFGARSLLRAASRMLLLTAFLAHADLATAQPVFFDVRVARSSIPEPSALMLFVGVSSYLSFMRGRRGRSTGP